MISQLIGHPINMSRPTWGEMAHIWYIGKLVIEHKHTGKPMRERDVTIEVSSWFKVHKNLLKFQVKL